MRVWQLKIAGKALLHIGGQAFAASDTVICSRTLPKCKAGILQDMVLTSCCSVAEHRLAMFAGQVLVRYLEIYCYLLWAAYMCIDGCVVGTQCVCWVRYHW